jgi:mono/diheme cytochrome c family protein
VIRSSTLTRSGHKAALPLTIAVAFSAWLIGEVHAETGVEPDPAAVARGAKLYADHCLSCHRKDGVGEPRVPWSIRRPDLIEAMPLNETSHAWHHGDEQLMSMILEGTQRSRLRMPVFRDVLSTEDAADLVAYIKSLWSKRILACQGPDHMRCM